MNKGMKDEKNACMNEYMKIENKIMKIEKNDTFIVRTCFLFISVNLRWGK